MGGKKEQTTNTSFEKTMQQNGADFNVVEDDSSLPF